MALIKGLIVAGALAYILVGIGLVVGQRRLIYFPDTARPDLAAVGDPRWQAVEYRSADGNALLSWYAPPAAGRPVIAYFHGNAGHIAYRAGKSAAFLDAGYGVLLAGYRGYGGNEGSPSEDGLYADARAALDFLGERGIAGERLVIYGESLGTAVATQMANERDARALVLEAPFSSALDVARWRFPIYPAGLILKDRFESNAKIAGIGMPVLIFHGERDGIVPYRFGRKLFAAAAEPKRFESLPAAGHNDLYDHGAAEKVLAFLKTLARTPALGATGSSGVAGKKLS